MLEASGPLSRREAHAPGCGRCQRPQPGAEAAPTRQIAHPDERDRGISHLSNQILGTLDEIRRKANASSVPAPMLAEDRSVTIQMTNS